MKLRNYDPAVRNVLQLLHNLINKELTFPLFNLRWSMLTKRQTGNDRHGYCRLFPIQEVETCVDTQNGWNGSWHEMVKSDAGIKYGGWRKQEWESACVGQVMKQRIRSAAATAAACGVWRVQRRTHMVERVGRAELQCFFFFTVYFSNTTSGGVTW